jgi:BirA family transcriptional regulator, biotin operon repressor / biotin---[acetyl-CoA-carboxylase] ligase
VTGDNAIARPASVAGRRRFHDVRRVEATGSTNSDVMALARDGEGEGLVLVADHQTAGRGRAGRTWTAPPGASLLCTILLRPPAPVAPLVTFALAVAAAEAVEQLTGVRPGLKWPNDLVVEDEDPATGGVRTRKLAGILAEAEWSAGSNIAAGHHPPSPHERATVAAGIGLNVAWPDALPEELADIAVALNHLSDVAVSRDEVLEALLDRLDHHYGALVSGQADQVLEAWRARSATLGREVRVDLGRDDVVGTAVDVTDAGQLVVDSLEGARRTIAVGDVVHLRPA